VQLEEGIELVIAADVARRLGVSKQRVGVLAKQSGFPNPIGVLGRSQVWRWSTVETWAIETGRLAAPRL
jgi:predicted DNA-binding transcriptional regulator AlpA